MEGRLAPARRRRVGKGRRAWSWLSWAAVGVLATVSSGSLAEERQTDEVRPPRPPRSASRPPDGATNGEARGLVTSRVASRLHPALVPHLLACSDVSKRHLVSSPLEDAGMGARGEGDAEGYPGMQDGGVGGVCRWCGRMREGARGMRAGDLGCKRGRKGRDGVKGDKEAEGVEAARIGGVRIK